jgi:DNA-binding NarL/FixJ family response regulator
LPVSTVSPSGYSCLMRNRNELTVLIIDEHSGISPVLSQRLSLIPGISVIGETANVMLGAELAHQLEPDLILADFRRTGPPRSETYRWLCRVSPRSKVVAHTSYVVDGDERALREAGVTRCILKGGSVRRLGEELLAFAHSDPGNGTRELNGKEHRE